MLKAYRVFFTLSLNLVKWINLKTSRPNSLSNLSFQLNRIGADRLKSINFVDLKVLDDW